ncbi:MAG TPA: response regulator [Thioploca sp.]|nr:response regulator [Thioploca sp.]
MNNQIKINILLVDDERASLLFLTKVLDDPTYHLVCANSAQEALDWLRLNQECALVVLDINLDDSDGFEIAKFVRAQPNTKDTPIIFVTGMSHRPEYLAQAYALGAIDYIIKPFNPDIVKTKVAVLVDLYRKTIQLQQTNAQLQQVILKHQQTEQALREQSQTLRAILDATLDIIIMLELDGTIVTINPTGAAQFGMNRNEIIDHCFYDLLPPKVAAHRILAIEEVIRTKKSVFFEKDRSGLWFECNFYPVCNEEGHVIRIALFGRDTTQRKQAEEELRTQQELLRLVIDSVPHLIFWKDLNSVYLGCNQNFAKMANVDTPEHIIGQTDFDLPWKPFEPSKFRADDRRVMNNNTPEYHLIETTVGPTNGQQIWVDTSKVPLHDATGTVIGILGAFENITERKQAELELQRSKAALEQANAELNQFKTTLDMMLDCVFMVDCEESPFFYVNQGAINQLGYTQEELLQMTLSDINPEYTDKELSEWYARLYDGSLPALTVETIHRHKNGTLIPVEVFVQYIQVSEQVHCFVGVARDMTERKQAEAYLTQAKEAAEAANRAKSTFLANMSHELRTPLNGILGYTQILKRDNTLNAEQQEGIDIIHHSGEYLLTLINDILDLSKIEAERMELDPTDFQLDDFIKGIVELFRMRAEQKGIAFNYQPLSPLPKGIHADEKRLRQILINLLNNAIKFTKQGGVQFKVSYCQGKIRFQVEDTGPGIAPEFVTKIFQPFQQVGDLNDKAEGTGLGLSITQKLVDMMGGEIQLDSVLGQGTTFWAIFKLPEVDAVESLPADERIIVSYKKNAPNKVIKILVVDDKWENRSVLIKLLTPLGFEIVVAVNGIEAVGLALMSPPDLILMDLVMPVMDGFTATGKIREKLKEVVIIAVSASAFDFHQQRSMQAGCNDFLAKPIRAELLLERLREHLNLEWVYEQAIADTKNEAAEHGTNQMPLVGPSAQQAAVLFDLAMIGDIYGICDYVKQLEQSNKQMQPFAQKIYQLANDLKDNDIRQIAQHFMENTQ